jgi:hypothetical protein
MVSTPATAVQNFLRAIGEASSQTDVENYIESRLELVRLCSMTTVLDIVAHSRRLVDADIFEHLNERTGNMDPIGVCNTEYELFCEVGAIWLANQHRMRPFQPQPHMNCRQRRLFQQNRRDLGTAIVDSNVNSNTFFKTAWKKHLWLGDSGASCHMTNDDTGMFDCCYMDSYLTLGNGQRIYSGKIGKKKVTVVHVDGSTVDIVLLDCKFVPDLHVNLFSITKALSDGWELSNRGLSIVLQTPDLEVIFDCVMKTENGYVTGVAMVPTFNTDIVAMKKHTCDPCLSPLGGESTFKRNQHLSPLGGETASNYLGDKFCIQSSTCQEDVEARDGPSNNALNCSKHICKNFVSTLLDGDPSVARQKCTFTMQGYNIKEIKESNFWYMVIKKNEKQKSLDKIDSFFNDQNVMVNKILSYIEILCHNKRVYYNTDIYNLSSHHVFKLTHINTVTWENGEQISKHGETRLLNYSILIKDDVQIKEFILTSSEVYHVQQLIFENYSGF